MKQQASGEDLTCTRRAGIIVFHQSEVRNGPKCT